MGKIIVENFISYLNHCIEHEKRNNDDQERRRGHDDNDQRCHDGEEGEDEGTQRARDDLVDDVSVF